MHRDPGTRVGRLRRRPRLRVRLAALAVGTGLVAVGAAGPGASAGAAPAGPALVRPTGRLVYVTSTAYGNTVTAYDVTTASVVAAIPIAGEPFDVAFSPTGTAAYATESAGGLAVIDVGTSTVTKYVPVGARPTGLAVSPDGGTVYVANQDSDTVSVVRTATGTVAATIPVGWMPQGVAVSPDGSTVYVTDLADGTVSVIATATDTVTSTIAVGDEDQPSYVVFNPSGTTAYVTDAESATLSVINTATRAVTATVPVGSNPFGLAISPNGAAVYVADMKSDVTVVSTATDTVTATIPINSGGATELAVAPDDGAVYVTAFGNPGDLDPVVDPATNTVTGTLNGVPGGWGIAVSPDPRVTGVGPDSGPPAGGNQVAITGIGIGDATGVSFGGTPAASFAAVSPDGVEAVAPPGAAGPVDVTVTTPRGTSAVVPADRYSYLGAPTVSGITPDSGPSIGGTLVTIEGTGFSGTTTVEFGSVAARTVYSETPTQLEVLAPAAVPFRTVDITVRTPLGTSATSSADKFTYTKLINVPPPPPGSRR